MSVLPRFLSKPAERGAFSLFPELCGQEGSSLIRCTVLKFTGTWHFGVVRASVCTKQDAMFLDLWFIPRLRIMT